LLAGLFLLWIPARGASTPVGSWDFENPQDLLQATVGQALTLHGSHSSIAGPRAADRAVRIGVGSWYECTHRIASTGPGVYVNQYSLLVDFRIPALGPWYCFFQTQPANTNDGDCFVRAGDGALGVGQTGYSADPIEAARWYRLIVAVDNSQGVYRLYLDGELWLDGKPQPVDGRFSLDSQLLLFADENGEDGAIDVARVAIYDTCLAAGEAAVLGGVYPGDVTNQPPRLGVPATGPAQPATGTPAAFSFQATDPDGDAVSLRIDWGDDTGLSAWSEGGSPGQAVSFTHTYRQPGTFVIRGLPRDARGGLGVWTEALTVTVTGEALAQFLTLPYLQNVRTNGITLMWELDLAVTGEVEYGVGPVLDQRTTATRETSNAGTTIYRCVLQGLTPGTRYEYRTRNGGREGAGGSFTTAPAGRPDFTFAVWSDSQGSNHGAHAADPLEPTKAMFRHMAANGVDLAFTSGDLAENGASYADTRQFYLDRVAALLGVQVPWFVAWGNHDGGAGTVIRQFADLPSQVRPGYASGFGSYSFDYAGCHFICLDHASLGADLKGWLVQDLQSAASRQARFTFVFVHVPPFCELWIDGDATLRQSLVPLLEAHGVDVCFSGHTHEYERGELRGVFYCITGGGSWLDHPEVLVRDWPHLTVGGQHAIPGVVKPGPTRGGGLVNEYVRVDVRGDSFTATMIGFAPDGTELGVLDEFGRGDPPGLALQITSADRVPEGLRLEWTGPAGPYQVQLRLNLVAGDWVDYGPVLGTTQRTAVVPVDRSGEFFRVRLAR
jgi:hypothetical protein